MPCSGNRFVHSNFGGHKLLKFDIDSKMCVTDSTLGMPSASERDVCAIFWGGPNPRRASAAEPIQIEL